MNDLGHDVDNSDSNDLKTTMADEAVDRTRSPRSRTRLLEKPPGKSGEDLVHSFAQMDEGIRKLIEAGSYGGAERSIADWKADVAQLATLVRSQIDRCRILRTSDTLEAVLQDDPHVKSVAVRHIIHQALCL